MSNGTKDRSGSSPYRTLRERILTLELRPGSVLDEAGLSRQLEVSRTPIREAIIQLIADGLVVREGRSARVAPLDLDDIPPLYDALLISSRMIQRLAAEFRTEADLQVIREKNDALRKTPFPRCAAPYFPKPISPST
ncbi:GntR family transcriptional regulator [Roseibium salinum]|nr:GntR family transcriptional regulator [Roseibium salinum]